MPIGERYLRYARGLPKHPERAFGEQTDEWRFKQGDEVFTATRRTNGKVWRVIFELDDGSTFLKVGENRNLTGLWPGSHRGLTILDSTVFPIGEDKFHGRERLFYEPDGELDSVSADFNRIGKDHPGKISGTFPHYLMERALESARNKRYMSERTVPCQTSHMDGKKFRLGFSAFSEGTHGQIHLERKATQGGIYGYNRHIVPMHLEHPWDAVDFLRRKINLAAGEILM